MKLTSQEEYGLRCILALARPRGEGRRGEQSGTREQPRGERHGRDGFRGPSGVGSSEDARPSAFTVAQIAEREGISAEYAGKLLGVLVRAGLVESERGRYGGYRLRRPPEEITVADALTALGGKLYDDDTCDRFAGDHSLCVHTNGCTIRSIWSGLQEIIDQVLTQTTLWDLIQQNEHGVGERIRRRTELPASFEVGDQLLVQGPES